MPITLELQDDNTIMYWAFVEPWSINELDPLFGEANRLFAQSTQPIQILIDVSQTHQLPNNVLSIRKKATWGHENSGQTAVIGTSAFVKMMIETIFKLVRAKRVHFFDTEAEARAYLHMQTRLVDNPASAF